MLIAILLPLLPNLTMLDVKCFDDGRWIRDMIKAIPYSRTPALTKLKVVNLETSSLDHVRVISALPSVRNITAPDIEVSVLGALNALW